MEKSSKDALDELFVSETEVVSNDVLRNLLRDYAQMSTDGKIFPLPAFSKLDNEKKILITLLAKKVLRIKLDMEEKTFPKEIQNITGLSKGSVNPTLRVLNGKKRLINCEKGAYWVPNHAIHPIRDMFTKKTGD